MSELETVNESVVLVADSHNPAILNPDFLQKNDIVPSEWGVRETFTTPALSRVVYDSGCVWEVNPQRNIVQQNQEGHLDAAHSPYKMATKYIETLPHVRYQAIGLNMRIFSPIDNPVAWIKSNILKYSGPAVSPFRLHSAGVNLNFELDDENVECNLQLAHARETPTEESKKGLVMDFNLHVPGPFDSVETMREILVKWPDRRSAMSNLAKSLLQEK